MLFNTLSDRLENLSGGLLFHKKASSFLSKSAFLTAPLNEFPEN
jgi:hypothetical protein